MAADGSLKFDTKINTEGFEAGISSLKDTMERLIRSVDGLSNNMIKSFTGIGNAAADSSKGVDKITEAAAEAENALKKTQAVQERTDKASGTTRNSSSSITDSFNDGTSAGEQLVDQVDRLKEHLYYLERQGLSFGNTDYDETFGALKRAETALNQYKKELIETEEALNKTREAQERASRFTGTIHNNTGSGMSAEPGYDYEKEADAEIAKLRELQAAMQQTATTADAEFRQAAEEPSRLRNMVELVKQSFMDIPSIIRAAAGSITNAFDGNTLSGAQLVDQVDRLKEHLYYLERQGFSFGHADYDETFGALKRAETALAQYKKGLAGTATAQKKVSSSGRKMNATMKDTKKAAVPLTQSIFKLSNMFKLMLIRMAMRAVIQAAKEGFENLAQYSEETNKSLSILMSALTRLKNSFATAFAPVLNAVAPALRDMINLLSEAATMAGQLFAVLTGKSTFVKAVDVQEDFADSIKGTTKAEKDSAKEAEKSVASFDDLIVIREKSTHETEEEYKPPTPEQMFETVEVDAKIKNTLDTIKTMLSSFAGWLADTFGKSIKTVWDGISSNITSLKKIFVDIFADIRTLVGPFWKWFSTDFVDFSNQFILTAGGILNGLFDTFNMIFKDIWERAVFPILDNFISSGLPMLTQFVTECLGTLNVLFGEIKKIFDKIWQKAIAPAITVIVKIWTEFIDILYEKWKLYGEPIFEAINEAIEATGDIIQTFLDVFWLPVWNSMLDIIDEVWAQHLKPLLDKFIDFSAETIQSVLRIYNEAIAPLVKWFVEELGPPISEVLIFINDVFGDVIGGIIDAAGYLIDALGGVVDFITGIFTGDIELALNGLGDIFKGVFNAIIGIVETAVNAIIKILNSIQIDVPDWIPGLGGKTFGFDIKEAKIPRLATGTVVPPRAGEFAAILGDNRRETEIVSPLSTMKQALLEALAENGGMDNNRPIQIDMIVDGQRFARAVYKANNSEKQRVGIRMVTEG